MYRDFKSAHYKVIGFEKNTHAEAVVVPYRSESVAGSDQSA